MDPFCDVEDRLCQQAQQFSSFGDSHERDATLARKQATIDNPTHSGRRRRRALDTVGQAHELPEGCSLTGIFLLLRCAAFEKATQNARGLCSQLPLTQERTVHSARLLTLELH